MTVVTLCAAALIHESFSVKCGWTKRLRINYIPQYSRWWWWWGGCTWSARNFQMTNSLLLHFDAKSTVCRNVCSSTSVQQVTLNPLLVYVKFYLQHSVKWEVVLGIEDWTSGVALSGSDVGDDTVDVP